MLITDQQIEFILANWKDHDIAYLVESTGLEKDQIKRTVARLRKTLVASGVDPESILPSKCWTAQSKYDIIVQKFLKSN